METPARWSPSKRSAPDDLLVKMKMARQVEDLLRLRKFHSYDVITSILVAMNSCKGVISCKGSHDLGEKWDR